MVSLYQLRGILLDQCLAEPNLPATRKALSSFHSVSYGARYTVVSWSTSPSRIRSSHPTRPRTFLLIDASAKKYTVENVVTPRTVISTSCPNASKLLFAVRNRFKGASPGPARAPQPVRSEICRRLPRYRWWPPDERCFRRLSIRPEPRCLPSHWRTNEPH